MSEVEVKHSKIEYIEIMANDAIGELIQEIECTRNHVPDPANLHLQLAVAALGQAYSFIRLAHRGEIDDAESLL